MSNQNKARADGISILYLAQQNLSHPRTFLYYALHGQYPCYVCSDATLAQNDFIPFGHLNQQFKNAAIGGVTTYIHAPPATHHAKKGILDEGRDFIANPGF